MKHQGSNVYIQIRWFHHFVGIGSNHPKVLKQMADVSIELQDSLSI
jgi:hypothetical protein